LWSPSWAYSYDVALDSHATLGGGTLAKFTYRAVMELATRNTDDGMQFLCRFRNGKFVAEGDAQKNFDALANELEQYMVFTLERGRVVDPRRKAGATPFAITLSRTLIGALQAAPYPPSDGASSWVVEERDASGDYSAEYSVTPNSKRIAKRKLEYKPVDIGKLLDGQRSAKLEPSIEESSGVVDVEDQKLAHVEYTEVLGINSFPGSPASSTTKLELSLIAAVEMTMPPPWDAIADELQPADLETAKPSAKTAAAYDSLRIGDYTFEKALGELEAIARDPEGTKISNDANQRVSPAEAARRKQRLNEQGKVFSALAAIFRQDEKAVDKALMAIRRKSPARRLLLDALGSSGAPRAQSALAGIMLDQKQAAGIRQAAAFSLARTQSPTEEAINAMLQLLGPGPLQQHALLGVGTLARRLRDDGDGALAARVANRLVDSLKRASTPALKVNVLRAIANSGHASAFDAVKPAVSDKSAKVRSAAVDAIRLMDHPEVDGVIASSLLEDEERAVQASAVEAIRLREPSDRLASALSESLRSGVKLAVKLKVIAVMGQWKGERPELQRELERVVAESTVPKLRDAARRALGS
jgi:hypothetical protein